MDGRKTRAIQGSPDRDRDSTYRFVFLYAAIAGAALAVGVAVFAYVTISALQDPLSADPALFADLMNKWGGVVQGTIGIAVALAGVLVTIRIANSALRAAESAVLIAREQQKRESERYAREVKGEIYRFARDCGEVFAAVHQHFNRAIFSFDYTVFLARSVAMDGDYLAEHCPRPDQIVRHAAKVAEVLEAASECAGDMGNLSDEDKSEYQSSARAIRTSLSRCEHPSSFVEVSGVSPNLQNLRDGVQPLLLRLKYLIADMEGNGLARDLICSDRDADSGLSWLRHRVDSLLAIINDDDRLFDRFGRAMMIAELSLKAGDSGYGSAFDYRDALGFPMLFSFFEQSTAGAFDSHTDGLIGVSKAAGSFLALLNVMASDNRQMVKVFSLNASDDEDFVPRSMLSYRPPSKLRHFVDRIETYLPLLKANESARYAEQGGLDESPRCQVERSLQYWKGLCESRLTRRSP